MLAGQWVTRDEVRRAEGLVSGACRECGEPVRMQIRRGTGYCSARCEEHEVPF
jgi:hypothetical protein